MQFFQDLDGTASIVLGDVQSGLIEFIPERLVFLILTMTSYCENEKKWKSQIPHLIWIVLFEITQPTAVDKAQTKMVSIT